MPVAISISGTVTHYFTALIDLDEAAFDLRDVAVARVGDPHQPRLVLVAQRQVQHEVERTGQAERRELRRDRGRHAGKGGSGIAGGSHAGGVRNRVAEWAGAAMVCAKAGGLNARNGVTGA